MFYLVLESILAESNQYLAIYTFSRSSFNVTWCDRRMSPGL